MQTGGREMSKKVFGVTANLTCGGQQGFGHYMPFSDSLNRVAEARRTEGVKSVIHHGGTVDGDGCVAVSFLRVLKPATL